MLPLTLKFTFPDTLISIAVILLVAMILVCVLRHGINVAVKRAKRLSLARQNQAREEVMAQNAKFYLRPKALNSKAKDFLADAAGLQSERAEKRAKTIGSLLKSIVTVTVWAIAILTILDTIGIPTTSVIASAGIGGVALAFGAQTLIKDFLSGIFMIFEDQYGVGDYIQVGNIAGTVEEVSLRVTRIRDLQGGIWYIRNGEITQVGNESQGWATGIILVSIAPEEDADRAIEVLQKVTEEVYQDPLWFDQLLQEPVVAGVTEVDASAQKIQIMAMCPATAQYAARREILQRSVKALAEAGIAGAKLAGHPGNIEKANAFGAAKQNK